MWSLSKYLISRMEGLFLPSILATSAYNVFSFLIKLRTFTFSLKGSTSQLLFGISEPPAFLLRHFGAIIK